MINLVWAMTKDYVIGQNNSLPWKIKAEMQHFTNLTKHHTVLMGRKTFESIGSPLKERHNVVLTRNQQWAEKNKIKYPQLEITKNWKETVSKFFNKDEQLFIIGGKEIFYQTYCFADKLYISMIKENYPGNVKLDLFSQMIKNFELVEKNEFLHFTVEIYQKKPFKN